MAKKLVDYLVEIQQNLLDAETDAHKLEDRKKKLACRRFTASMRNIKRIAGEARTAALAVRASLIKEKEDVRE